MTDREPYSADVTTDAADAPPPDAPADAPATGPDIGKTWGLSDEAASALYPDVDDAPPPQVNPADEQVPPPFAQRPSPLLDLVRMYGAGHADWPQTKQALVDFDYAPLPAPTGAPTGPAAGQWYADVENNAQGPEVPGSWPELVAAADHGMLTQQELDEVLAARAGKGQEGDPSGGVPQE